jgi:hypothetical protein
LGYKAEIFQGALPVGKPAVLGAQIGTPQFDWKASRSQFVPGALADNLTSLGGVMSSQGGQTKLTELIKAGAAGSSGTVTEPFALQEKFPHPHMYAYYASGATLAEAFYLSVTGPYQLLIVGDPLCKPFSHAPQLDFDTEIRYLQPGDVVALAMPESSESYEDWSEQPEPLASRQTPLPPIGISVLFDGGNPRSGPVKPNIEIKTAGLAAGYHEVQVRFAGGDPLAQRSEVMMPLWIGPRNVVRVELPKSESGAQEDKTRGEVSLREDSKLVARVVAEGASRISLWHDWEQLATASGSEADFSIQLTTLGMGPVRLQARAEFADGSAVSGEPLWIEVQP